MKTKSTSPCPSEPQKQNQTNLTKVYTVPPGTLDPPLGFQGQLEIFVGSWEAVKKNTLLENRIMGVLNVAYDCDDIPPKNEEGKFHYFNMYYQLAKVGLIDGYGNNTSTMVAALYMADQLFTFPPHTPQPKLENNYVPFNRGNLLIHCWDGGSRSITIAALYLYYKFGVQYKKEKFQTFEDAYTYVINKRAPHARNSLKPGTCQTARDVVQKYPSLF